MKVWLYLQEKRDIWVFGDANNELGIIFKKQNPDFGHVLKSCSDIAQI